MTSRTVGFISLSLLWFTGLSVSSMANDSAINIRSIRPIVPIKQNISADDTAAHEQTVSIQIPAPTRSPSSALFPEASIGNVALSDELEENEVFVELDEADEERTLPRLDSDAPTLSELREEAHRLANRGLTYSFGSDNPDTGGLDCSGAMQYLLKKIGIKDVPRTSYDQYSWLKRKKLLDDVYGKSASKKLLKKLSPGDLIFWGGTWKSGHRVSHVMLYMGYDPATDTHYVFGARGKSSKGLLGNGVDIFELDPNRGRLIGHGKIPGLLYD